MQHIFLDFKIIIGSDPPLASLIKLNNVLDEELIHVTMHDDPFIDSYIDSYPKRVVGIDPVFYN